MNMVKVHHQGSAAVKWAALLTLIPALIAVALTMDFYIKASLIGGLLIFGALFAVNSSLHSYLIVRFASVMMVYHLMLAFTTWLTQWDG